jgi:hypothetical protein
MLAHHYIYAPTGRTCSGTPTSKPRHLPHQYPTCAQAHINALAQALRETVHAALQHYVIVGDRLGVAEALRAELRDVGVEQHLAQGFRGGGGWGGGVRLTGP